MDAEKIKTKVELHGKWLRDEDGNRWVCAWGEDLRGADLSGADLREADLSGAYLSGADLREADLSRADLSGAYLSGADLREADLSRADLREADLSDANLRGADLRWANLRWANLRGTNGDQFVVFQAGKHQAIFTAEEGFIGCERHSAQEWLERYREIGAENGYTEAEIETYGKFIALAVGYFAERAEKVQAAHE